MGDINSAEANASKYSTTTPSHRWEGNEAGVTGGGGFHRTEASTAIATMTATATAADDDERECSPPSGSASASSSSLFSTRRRRQRRGSHNNLTDSTESHDDYYDHNHDRNHDHDAASDVRSSSGGGGNDGDGHGHGHGHGHYESDDDGDNHSHDDDGDDHSHDDDHDGKKVKKKTYRNSCPVGQFFLDPCLFLSIRCGACLSALTSSSSSSSSSSSAAAAASSFTFGCRCRRRLCRCCRRRSAMSRGRFFFSGGGGATEGRRNRHLRTRKKRGGMSIATAVAAAAASLTTLIVVRWLVNSSSSSSSLDGMGGSKGLDQQLQSWRLRRRIDVGGSGIWNGWYGRGWYRSDLFPPVVIPSLDRRYDPTLGEKDIGGWMTPYALPRVTDLDPIRPAGSLDAYGHVNNDDDDDEDEKDSDTGEKEKQEGGAAAEEEGSSDEIEHVTDDPVANDRPDEPDYGGLVFRSLRLASGEEFARVIDVKAENRYQQSFRWGGGGNANRRGNARANKNGKRRGKEVKSPHVGHLYAFDDDYVFDPVCRRNSWWSLYKPNCNAFHEIDLPRKFEDDVIYVSEDQVLETHYISHGYYRDVWLVENHSYESTEKEAMVLKLLRWKHKYNFKQMETVRKDAVVMERLTSSPRIVDIYGHCAFSVTAEELDMEVEEFVVPGSGYAKQADLDDSKDVVVKNDFNTTEKVEMALAMAESIADLHGFKDGVIVHDDIQLCQWLRTKGGTLKLGDFNRAEIMLWDEEKQVYCKYNNGPGFGNYRAPEEFAALDLNEQIDVFSMGNNIYGLLTGLWVFYENEDDEVVQEKLIEGETAFIDDRFRTRSYAERRLVEIMERCWEKDPDKRVTIFDIVAFLRETLEEHKRLEGRK